MALGKDKAVIGRALRLSDAVPRDDGKRRQKISVKFKKGYFLVVVWIVIGRKKIVPVFSSKMQNWVEWAACNWQIANIWSNIYFS